MTKREISERLMEIRDNMIHGQDSANSMGELSCVLSATGKLIRDLILDIAAPEEDKNDLIGLWRRTGRLEPSSSEEQKSKEVDEAAEAFERLHRAGIVDEHGKLSEWYRDDNADQRMNT